MTDAPVTNDWANRQPANITELLRQLSANTGQSAMPGGRGGDVRISPFGSNQPSQQNVPAAHYGETGGETTFFNQSQNGGMRPISSVQPVAGWNPLGTATAAATGTGTTMTTDQIKALIAQLFPQGIN